MTDVFISHAREDQAACDRLVRALTSVGLVVARANSSDENLASDDALSTGIYDAHATLVLWSASALTTEQVAQDAQGAMDLEPKAPSAASSRYAGLILDETVASQLPPALQNVETPSWETWFAAPDEDLDDPRFIRLLTNLELLTGRAGLTASARALATRDADLRRLKAQLAARDEALSLAASEKSALEKEFAAQAEDLQTKSSTAATLSQELAEKSALAAAHGAKISELNEQLASLEGQLRDEAEALHARRAELVTAQGEITQLSTANQALSRQLEDARSGLSGALRQHKTLQAQIDASDQIIREIMTQREGLIAVRERLEKDAEKLSSQLNDTSRRLQDADTRRATYEVALVERTKEIWVLEEQVTSFGQELGTLRPQAEALSATVKTWGHVPWRSIAAGGLAAGALITYVGALGGQAIDSWLAPRPTSVALQSPSAAGPAPVEDASDPLQPKTEAKIDPDTIPTVDHKAPNAFEVRDPNRGNDGAIPIPNESETPVSNDQVQFNPDGLPPVDADSRPPPQDLPPMQQKPKLLLKPPAPRTPSE